MVPIELSPQHMSNTNQDPEAIVTGQILIPFSDFALTSLQTYVKKVGDSRETKPTRFMTEEDFRVLSKLPNASMASEVCLPMTLAAAYFSARALTLLAEEMTDHVCSKFDWSEFNLDKLTDAAETELPEDVSTYSSWKRVYSVRKAATNIQDIIDTLPEDSADVRAGRDLISIASVAGMVASE